MKTCKQDSRRVPPTRGMRRRHQDSILAAQQRSVKENHNVPAAGASSAIRQQLQQQQQQPPAATTTLRAGGKRSSSSSSPLLCSYDSDTELGPQQQSIDDGKHCRQFEDIEGEVVTASGDGRVACSNCNRRFSAERVRFHQEICERVNTEEHRERRIAGRIKNGVRCNVRSATQRPRRSPSGYGAGRRQRRAQELRPGFEHDWTHLDFDGSERLVCACMTLALILIPSSKKKLGIVSLECGNQLKV